LGPEARGQSDECSHLRLLALEEFLVAGAGLGIGSALKPLLERGIIGFRLGDQREGEQQEHWRYPGDDVLARQDGFTVSRWGNDCKRPASSSANGPSPLGRIACSPHSSPWFWPPPPSSRRRRSCPRPQRRN